MSAELEKKLRTMRVVDLKKEISKTNVRGYSKLKKEEVIQFMLKNKKRFMYLLNQEKQFIKKGGKTIVVKKKEKEKEKPKKKEFTLEDFIKIVNEFIKSPTQKLLDEIDNKFEFTDDLDEDLLEDLEKAIDEFEKSKKKSEKIKKEEPKKKGYDYSKLSNDEMEKIMKKLVPKYEPETPEMKLIRDKLFDYVKEQIDKGISPNEIRNQKHWLTQISNLVHLNVDEIIKRTNKQIMEDENKKMTEQQKELLFDKGSFKEQVEDFVISDFSQLAYTADADKSSSFMCYPVISNYVFLKILEKHKNDCIFLKKDYDLTETGAIRGGLELTLKQIKNPEMRNKIINKYKQCKKENKLLVLNINVKFPKFEHHRNAIIINPFLNTVEYYEPHGSGFINLKENKETIDKLMENFVKQVNKKLPENDKLTYSPSELSCPKLSKETMDKIIQRTDKYPEGYELKGKDKKRGLQSIAGLDFRKEGRGKSLPNRKEGTFFFNKKTGFCCMWSFLQMDFRLTRPKLPPNQLATLLLDKFKKDPVNLTHKFITAYAQTFMNDLVKNLKGGINTLGQYLLSNYSTKIYGKRAIKFRKGDKGEAPEPISKKEEDYPDKEVQDKVRKEISEASEKILNNLLKKV